MESILIETNSVKETDLLYSVYTKDNGWTSFIESGNAIGNISRHMPINDIRIKLSDKLEEKYDVEYRVCYENNIWTRWFRNAEYSNMDNSKDIYNIEIRILKK